MASRSNDPKQLVHVRIKRSTIKKLDRYSRKLEWTRSMSIRRIIEQWADGQ